MAYLTVKFSGKYTNIGKALFLTVDGLLFLFNLSQKD